MQHRSHPPSRRPLEAVLEVFVKGPWIANDVVASADWGSAPVLLEEGYNSFKTVPREPCRPFPAPE